jgi:hypothetical protein
MNKTEERFKKFSENIFSKEYPSKLNNIKFMDNETLIKYLIQFAEQEYQRGVEDGRKDRAEV